MSDQPAVGVPTADLTAAAGLVAAVDHALRRGFLEALDGTSLTASALAARTGTPPALADVLVRQLLRAGVVARDERGRLSCRIQPAAVRRDLERWTRFAERAEGPVGAAVAAEELHPLAPLDDAIAGVVADVLATEVVADGEVRVLDVGRRGTPVVRRLLAAGVDARVRAVTDPLAGRLPHDIDIALLVGVVHHLDDDRAVLLLRRVVRALRDGGVVAVVEPLLDEDGGADAVTAALEVELWLTHPGGRLRPFSRVAAWCAQVGLTGLARHDLPGPAALVLGHLHLRTAGGACADRTVQQPRRRTSPGHPPPPRSA